MSEPDPRTKLPALYSLTAIGIATFLGTILAGGYMLAANYKALGKERLGMYTIYGTFVSLAIFVSIAARLPINAGTLVVANVLPVLVVLVVAHKLQGEMFAAFEAMGGSYHSVWRTILIALAATVIYLFTLVLFAAVFGLETLAPAPEPQ